MIARVDKQGEALFLEIEAESAREGWFLRKVFDRLWKEGKIPMFSEYKDNVGFRIRI